MAPTCTPLRTESRRFDVNSSYFAFKCDQRLAEAIRSLAVEEQHESSSRVIRRWMRTGAAAEGIALYGEPSTQKEGVPA